MITQAEHQTLVDRFAALRGMVIDQAAARIEANPALGEAIAQQLERMERAAFREDEPQKPADYGLGDLIGLGRQAGAAVLAPAARNVDDYEDSVASERIGAMADLYYIFQHEVVGVFRVVRKLQELFRAGTVRLSIGDGAQRLYRFDHRSALRYTHRDRLAAYCRAFGYCAATPPPGAQPNREFHHLLTHFIRETALFWRDKRISEVIRERPSDPSFGSIAVVRRAGLDLRNNLKHASYGHINVLRIEVKQLLNEAFAILSAPDVLRLFGADDAWDVVEEVQARYFQKFVNVSARQRLAVAGQAVLEWIAQPHVRTPSRTQFEPLLRQIAEPAEEWLTSAESLELTGRREP